jgi:hypothetical protein
LPSLISVQFFRSYLYCSQIFPAEGFVAQSELCAQGRVERMKTDITENESPLDRSVQSLLVVDDGDGSAQADMSIGDYEMSVKEQSAMKDESLGWPSRPSSPAAHGEGPLLAESRSPSPVRVKLKLESPIRKRKKKRRKRRRHSSSPERRSPSPAHLLQPLDTAPVAAETNSLKLRFRLASNGAADLIRLDGFVDAPKVPKLKIRLGGAQAITTSVASEPKLSASMSSSTPLNGLEQSDSESDSVHALTRTRASSNGLGSDAGIVQFSPESGKQFPLCRSLFRFAVQSNLDLTTPLGTGTRGSLNRGFFPPI